MTDAAALPTRLRDRLDELSSWPDPASPITLAEREARLGRAQALLDQAGCDALLVGPGASLRYFIGLDWTPSERLVALLLPRRGAPMLVCPAFERQTLQRTLQHALELRSWQEDEDPAALVAACLPAGAMLALDPELPFRNTEALRRAGLAVLDGAPVVDGCRRIKSPAELALMQQAMSMTLAVHALVAQSLEPGMSASLLRRFINAAHRALGAPDGSSFCAVQFGAATAYPHGVPGDQTLEPRDIVLVDTGCVLHGYHSDITRTWAFGAPDPEQARIWEIEHEAQAAAFAAVRPGVLCEQVDRAARAVLEAHGLGPDYRLPGLPHRTGHGIGMSIHEPAYIVRGDRTPLEPGMCFSIEPMIVVPERFGVRLEDHVVVTATGARWFTPPASCFEALPA